VAGDEEAKDQLARKHGLVELASLYGMYHGNRISVPLFSGINRIMKCQFIFGILLIKKLLLRDTLLVAEMNSGRDMDSDNNYCQPALHSFVMEEI